jgi:hypothetical protein
MSMTPRLPAFHACVTAAPRSAFPPWRWRPSRGTYCSRCRGTHLMMSSTLMIISAASVPDKSTWGIMLKV